MMAQEQRLQNYLDENPNAPFTSWISAVFPEAVDITLDSRFTIPGNPWLSVYEESWVERNSVCPKRKKQRRELRAINNFAVKAKKGFGSVLTCIAHEAQPSRNRRRERAEKRQLAQDEKTAQEAKELGKQLISDHLKAFLEVCPDAAYDSWIATLHPENAKIEIIDERFTAPPGSNPWLDVYVKTKSAGKNDVGTGAVMTIPRPSLAQRIATH